MAYENSNARQASELVEEIRAQMGAVRQSVRNFSHNFPAWAERVNIADVLLTCSIASLYPVVKDMEKFEADKRAGEQKAG